MRLHKIVKGLVHRRDGWHETRILMIKVFSKDGKWKGKWDIKKDNYGRPIMRMVI